MQKIKLSEIRHIRKNVYENITKLENPCLTEPFFHEVVRLAKYDKFDRALLRTGLNIEAHRHTKNKFTDSDRYKNELDHIGTILKLFGLLEEDDVE